MWMWGEDSLNSHPSVQVLSRSSVLLNTFLCIQPHILFFSQLVYGSLLKHWTHTSSFTVSSVTSNKHGIRSKQRSMQHVLPLNKVYCTLYTSIKDHSILHPVCVEFACSPNSSSISSSYSPFFLLPLSKYMWCWLITIYKLCVSVSCNGWHPVQGSPALSPG